MKKKSWRWMFWAVFAVWVFMYLYLGVQLYTVETERDVLREEVEELQKWSVDFDVDGEVYRIRFEWCDSATHAAKELKEMSDSIIVHVVIPKGADK